MNRPPGPGNDDILGRERDAQQFAAAPANALPLTAAEDRQFAFLAHCGGILGFLPSLIIYLIFKNRGPFTSQEAKEALNFTLPPTVLAVVANILALTIPAVGGIFALVAVLVWVFLVVSSLIAAIVVNRGNPYRYPLNLRLIH